MSTITEFLAEQKRLTAGATTGPWAHHETVHADNYVTAGGGILSGTHVCGPTYERANAAFIAAARSSVPRMIAALEAVMALHPNTSGECHTCSNEWGPLAWPCPTIRAIEAALIGGEG